MKRRKEKAEQKKRIMDTTTPAKQQMFAEYDKTNRQSETTQSTNSATQLRKFASKTSTNSKHRCPFENIFFVAAKAP